MGLRRVYGSLDGWVSNRRLQIGTGPVSEAFVEPIVIDDAGVLYEVFGNDAGINIRSAPNGSLVGGAPGGAQVTGTGEVEGSWIEITYNGTTGWAAGSFLRPVGAQ